MIYVSDAWKDAHEQMILPESFVEITMGVMDETVTGSVVCENESDFSNSSVVINNENVNPTKYAFLEHNLWSLDGSRVVMEDEDQHQCLGYVSKDDVTNKLTITLSEVANNPIPGFVITWSEAFEEYATKFTVLVKNGTRVVDSVSVTNNTSVISLVELPVSGYDSVTITAMEWSHPGQRNRIESVMFGQRIVFTKDDIVNYSHEQSGSPLGTELSKNSIEFEVDNSDGRWNPLNPSGRAKYLYERQKVTVKYGLDTINGIEWIQAGVFYLSEWKAPANGITATFVARDALDFMLNATYSRPYVDAVTVSEARVYLTKDAAVYTYLDDHLVTILPAGRAVKVYEKTVWYPDGYGGNYDDPGVMVYRIDEGWLWANYVSITSNMSLFNDISKAMMNSLPDDVERWVNDEISSGVNAPVVIEETTVAEFVQKSMATYGATIWQTHDGVLNATNPIIGAYLSDYTIGSNFAYQHPEVELAKPLRNVNVVQHFEYVFEPRTIVYEVNPSGDDITVDCPYLWYYETGRTDALAAKYINWWKHREVVSGEFRADPRLELFDVVEVETKYGVLSPVMITYIKYSYNGSFRGTYEGKVIEEA
jgi:hypothetical protein